MVQPSPILEKPQVYVVEAGEGQRHAQPVYPRRDLAQSAALRRLGVGKLQVLGHVNERS